MFDPGSPASRIRNDAADMVAIPAPTIQYLANRVSWHLYTSAKLRLVCLVATDGAD